MGLGVQVINFAHGAGNRVGIYSNRDTRGDWRAQVENQRGRHVGEESGFGDTPDQALVQLANRLGIGY